MRFLILLLIGTATSAHACDYCERKVTLTPQLAACYLAGVENEITQMQAAGLPAQLINLSSCDGAQTGTRGGGSLPVLPKDAPDPSLSFVLDAPALRCLARTLREESWSPDVIKTFEVTRDCQAD